jgi:hypothetical protein
MRRRSTMLLVLLTVLGSTASARAEPTPVCASSKATPIRTVPASPVSEDRSLGYVCVEVTQVSALAPVSQGDPGRPVGPTDGK